VRTLPSRVSDRAPSLAAVAGLLAILLTLLPGAVVAADWTRPERVAGRGGSRLDSLHQLAADGRTLHLVHPRIGRGATDDRVVYQRSVDGGARWSTPRSIFAAGRRHREVVPNLALAAGGGVVAAAWRTSGTDGTSLWVRVSRDGGRSFDERRQLFAAGPKRGIGVPAVAVVSPKVVAVAWTDRRDGRVLVRVSRDGGRRFGQARRLGETGLSIDCRTQVTDGLVGLAASRKRLYAAWSMAPAGQCLASSVVMRSSGNTGRSWERRVTITKQRSYGWPELDALGRRVVATVQSTSGGIILARSGDEGRHWRDRLLRARKGRNLSAADVVLLPKGRAMFSYVDEQLRRSKLVSTRVVSRWSPDDGRRLNPPRVVAAAARKLRLAPNIAAHASRPVIVVQSGPISGSPRHILVSRLR
jgi:hypothetical protein